jgi:hypothetical protein
MKGILKAVPLGVLTFLVSLSGTADLYRVNFEVKKLKPFVSFASLLSLRQRAREKNCPAGWAIGSSLRSATTEYQSGEHRKRNSSLCSTGRRCRR